MKTSILILLILMPGFLGAKESAFHKDLSAFYKNPRDLDLREKIIQDVLVLKSTPALPSAAVSLRGKGKEAFEKSQFKEAAQSLLTASEWAPWNAGLYSVLAQAQEKAGLYPEAIQSLDLYLLAAPQADDRPQVQDRLKKLDEQNKHWMADQIEHLDDDAVGNSLAARCLEMGSAAKAELPFLIKALKNNDTDTRAHAAFVLSQIKPPAVEAIPALMERLNDPQATVRANSVYALSKMGPQAVQALPDLIDSLRDDDQDVRDNASMALGNIGPAAAKAVPALAKALKDKDAKVRGNAAEALGKIGPAAKDALPVLEAMAKDSDPTAKKNAAWAVAQINAAAE